MNRRMKSCTILIAMLLISAWPRLIQAQSESEFALIQRAFFTNPYVWKMTKDVTNTYWGKDLFEYPRVAAQGYIMDIDYNLYSGMTFQLDSDWDRMIYYECLDNWIRAYGSHGTTSCQTWWPQGFDLIAPTDGYSYSSYYWLYVCDTENDRIVRMRYRWQEDYWVCDVPWTGGGLDRPIDLDINNNFDFMPYDNDYFWLINGVSEIKRITVTGSIPSTFGTFGCDGQVGTFCHLTAIISGRSVFQAVPFANTNDFYVADAGNSRIIWFQKNSGSEVVSWLSHVSTTPSIVDLEVDNFGQVWALDKTNGRITKYTPDLYPLCTFGSSGTGANQFSWPVSISNAGGFAGNANISILEAWTDSSGAQAFVIGTDVVDFSAIATKNNSWLYISYTLVDPSDVTVKIYDQEGGLVKTLFDDQQYSGACSMIWDGKDESGQVTPNGDYRLELVSECNYVNVLTGEPVNVVTKEVWFTHPCCEKRGDFVADGEIDISDLVYLVDYMFTGGPPPTCWAHANVDGSGPGDDSVPDSPDDIDISDLVSLVDYMFTGGLTPPPC